MEEWKEYKLGEISTMKYGKLPSSTKGGKYPLWSGYRYVGVSDIMNCPKDTLIVVARGVGGTGDVKVAKEDCFLTNLSISVNLNKTICNPYYLYYKYLIKNLKYLDSGSAQSQITIDALKNVSVILPPLSYQNKVISILKSLNDKIENNRKINENLEQQAQALFKSWFVDFEPFRDQPFVESELGMIPEGWRVYSLPEIVNVYSGYSYKGSELKESKNAMATIKNFDRSGGFKVDGYKEIELSDRIKTTQYANLFDVIVAHTDLTQNAEIIGNPALILNKNGYDKIIISMDLCKVVPKTSFIPNTLLYCILNDSRFKQHALGYVNGTTVLHLNKKALPDYKIALPCDLSNLFTITKAIDPLFRAESNNIIESSRLSQLRDTLLPRLMSGELSVK